jgi:microcystin-dependent protein
MGTPFLGEVRIAAFGFAPRGWALCNGQFLPINQNQALFALLGTTYGGNGQTNFALPDLRGRVPIHVGAGFTQGQRAGAEAHTVTIAEMPTHVHVLHGTSNTGTQAIPAGNLLAATPSQMYHAFDTAAVALAPAAIANVGGTQPHTNMQPFLTLSFCIALQGVFPSQN